MQAEAHRRACVEARQSQDAEQSLLLAVEIQESAGLVPFCQASNRLAEADCCRTLCVSATPLRRMAASPSFITVSTLAISQAFMMAAFMFFWRRPRNWCSLCSRSASASSSLATEAGCGATSPYKAVLASTAWRDKAWPGHKQPRPFGAVQEARTLTALGKSPVAKRKLSFQWWQRHCLSVLTQLT